MDIFILPQYPTFRLSHMAKQVWGRLKKAKTRNYILSSSSPFMCHPERANDMLQGYLHMHIYSSTTHDN